MSVEELSNYRKPVGKAGEAVVEKMYVGHADMTRAFVDVLKPAPDDVVLDVGCGGGFAISLLAEKAAMVYGIDYSDVSVAKAEAYNRDAVKAGRVIVRQAEVLDMPFDRGLFSLVTAIETVYFWERVDDCYKAVYDILKPAGRFAILMTSWKNGDAIVNEPEHMDILRLNLYSPDEFAASLKQAGFSSVEWRELTDDRCLCVIATKD
ncbi:MAG: class I SAM-dependent methyltransferase [Planctomycetes bacterium]|nr:class I SAM-dependent methyltransferase [Planctomycetota bacterium]MCC8115688.1 class I SAM-dependent methyltransferase [Planctomycetota bacterium]MCD7896693.1 class I SAM-dependent methyltransferase [Planctomycetaceae bacterium]